METEEEAREVATDGQEVQMEAADHLQTQPDSKLSTIKDIKGEAQITDSTEGMLKIPEDQVLVEAPSAIKTPSEHNLNGMASSLNGYVDKEEKISNKHPHEIEAIEDDNDTKTGEISDQSNEVFPEEAAKGKVMLENESTADIQPMQELESKETNKTELVDMSEIIHQKDDAVSQKKNQEDSPTTCELHVMESSEVSSVEASSAQAIPYQSNVAQCEEQATEENITESEPQILETESVQEMKDVEATEPECIFQQTIVTTSKESVTQENATAKEPAYDNKEIQNDEPALIKEHDDVKADEISNQRSRAIVEETVQETNLLASEPTNDVQVKELESEQISNTVDVEPQGVSPSDNVSTSEEFNTQETIKKDEPSSDNQAEESSVVIKDTEDEKNNAAITEEEAQDEHVVPTETTADTLLAHEPELEKKNNIESVEAEDNIAARDLPEEAIGTEAIPHESTTAGITELNEDVESNVALAEGAAPEEHILETEAAVDVSSVQEPEIEEIKNTNKAEQEQNSTTPEEINPQETVTQDELSSDNQAEESSVVIEDTEQEKNSAAIAEEEAQDEHLVPTETTADTLLAHEPELEEKNNIESVEAEDNIAARDLPEEAIGAEAIPHESTTAGITELSEDVESNVALAERAAPEEHILETEAAVHVSSVQETEIEEIKNTDKAEQEQNSSTPEEINPQQTVTEDEPSSDNQAEESSIVIKDTEHEKNSAAITEEEAQDEHAVPTEAAADTFLAHEPELEEKYNIESVEAKDNIEARDLPGEAIGTEAIPHERTTEGITELSVDVESNVAIVEGAAPEENILETEAANDVSSVQESEIEEIKDPDTAEQEQNSSTPEEINPQETVTQDEPSSDTQAEESSVVIKDTEDEKNSAAIAEEEAQDEHVVPTEEAADTFLAHEPELEEKNNIEPVEAEDIIAARDLPGEAIGTEAIPHESTAAGITELSENVGSNVAVAEGAAPEELILETEPTVDVSSVQEPEIEEIKNTDTAEQEQNSSTPEEINPQETVTQDESSSDIQAEESSVVIKDTEDEKNSAAIGEEEAQDELVVPTEAAADTFLAHEPELEEKNNIESGEEEENIAARDLPEEAIGTEAKPHESTAAGITELSEDVESNVAVAEVAAQDEPSSNNHAEESSVVIKDTEDEKNSSAIAEEEAQDEHVVPTEAAADTFLAHEPELEEKNNIESVEAEDIIAARDLPGEAIGTEAIPHESTAAGIAELSENVESNVAVAEGAAPEELILETEPTVDVSLVKEPEIEEIKNTDTAEQEQNSSTPEENNPQETVTPDEPSSDTQAEESSVVIEDTEDEKNSAAIGEEEAQDELVVPTETTGDTLLAHEPEVEEKNNIESVGAEDKITARDLAEEAIGTEAIPHESTAADITELSEDVESNVAIAEVAAQDEPSSNNHAEESSVVIKDTEDEKNSSAIAEEEAQDEDVVPTEAAADTFLAHEPELEEKNNIESGEEEENIAARDLPEEAIGTEAKPHESTAAGITELSEDVESNVAVAEVAAQDEPSSNNYAEESSVVIKDTEDEKNSSAIAEEEAQDEHVVPTEAAADTFLAHEPELEEKNNIESVEAEENVGAGDLPEEALATEAIPPESTAAGITGLSEDVESNVALVEGAAPEEHILETEIAVDVSSVQEPELEEVKNTDTAAEQEHNGSTPEEINSLETGTKDEPCSDTQAQESSVVIKDTEDVKNSAAIAEEEAQDEHVEEKKNIESVEAEDKIAAHVLPEEAIGIEAIPHESTAAGITELSEDVESNVALAEGAAPEEHILETEAAIDISSVLEPELEEIKDTETAEQEHNSSTPEEINPQETVTKDEQSSDTQAEESSVLIKDTEDVKNSAAIAEEAAAEAVLPTEAITDTLLAHEPELEDIKNIESVEPEDSIGASDLPGEEMGIKGIEAEAVPHESTTAGIKEHSEDVKSSVALDEEVTPEKHILETEVAVEISSVREPELEEIKNTDPSEQEHNITESGLPEEVMNNESMETEVIPHDRNVASIKELTEDDIVAASAPDADSQQVPEQESVEDVKCTDTTEHTGETSPSTFSTSDELTPTGEKTLVTGTTCDTQQVQSLTDQETKDSQYVKTEEFSELSTFSTPEEAAQDSDVLKSEPPSDVQQAQELDSAEETRGTEDAETDDCQQNGVSTLEETKLENNVAEVEPNVDDQHVQEVKSVVDVKENEARETEEISKQINYTTSENVAQESSEPGSERAFCVQPEQQIELTKDSEDNQLVGAEETSSQSNIITLEDPTGEDRVGNEIEPSVDTNQEHELELVEEIKDTGATEAEEASHTGQTVSLEEQFSESNELTHDIQQVNELDATEEMKGTEDISGEEICNQQTGTSEDPSPTDNGKAVQDYTVESNEENLGDEIDNVISVHEKIKDEIQESAELKDETSELGEKIQRSESRTEEDYVLISTEDTIETSNNINPIKEEPKDVVLQTQVCERSVETIEKQDEAVKNVSLDQQQKEDEGIEQQKEELQTDKQKHDDKQPDFIIDTQVETVDAFEAEQTDAVVTELLKNEVTQHISKDSIPRIADVMVENITEINEQSGDENGPNNEGPLEVAAESYNDGVQGSAEKDAVIAKTSSSEQDETTGEIRNEQVESCLAASVERDLQADSDLSNDQMLENNPRVVPQNDEYKAQAEEKEYTDKVNVDMHAIQESDKVVVDEAEEKQGMQNEDNVVRHDEFLITPEKEETSQLHSSEQYSVDTKTDDTIVSYEEITLENTSTHPSEIEDTEEKKGLSATSDFVVETSKQNKVEQDLSIHHQVEDEKLSTTEHNASEFEAMKQKVDLSIAETNNDNTTKPLPEHETEIASDINQNREYQEATNADDVMQIEPEDRMQLELEENAIDKTANCIEKVETSFTESTEVVTYNEDICYKASGADGVQSDESITAFEDTERNLDVSSVVTESKGENMNNEMEDYKLALPVQPIQDENSTERALGLDNTEKELTTPGKELLSEPEEQEENKVTEGQDEDGRHGPEIRDMKKTDQNEAEQDYLPVSSFLMNLILGKESNDPNGNSETEAEKKQEETTNDDNYLIASQQEESLVSFPIGNMVDEKLTSGQEKENVKGSEKTHEPVKEQSRDIKLDIKRSLETDEELKRNTHDLEDNAQNEIYSKLTSAEAAGLIEKIEARNFELDEKPFDTVCQENVEAATEIEEGSLKSNQDGTKNPKTSQQSTLEEGETELPHEFLHEDRSSDAMAEQTLSLIDPDIGDATKLSSDAGNVQNPPCTKQEESIESSYVEVRSTTEAQVESEDVEKKEENQHTIIGGDTNDEIWKRTGSEAISDEQASEITDQVSHTEINFAYEKEIPASSTCMNKKEIDKFSNNEVSNFEKALEIHSDSPNLPVNQDKQDESADNQIVMEHNSFLDKTKDSNLQEQQNNDTVQKFPIDTDEEKQKFMAITEHVIKEENVHETVETKSNEKQVFASQIQERGLDVVSPKAASEVEETFVEITKPEFSTDEEQSPKADESNIPQENTYSEKTKDEEENNNITDEATVKIEERGTGQKASHKKHNILSGVGSKVKHQLAKVKKAIIGKPGHTKSESPKS
ncbi:hypothetical protein ABZP36_032511 [Zizania latifolia]